MKYIIALLALGFIGCGDNSTGGTDAAGNQLVQNGIFSLYNEYAFKVANQDYLIWGLDDAMVGTVTNLPASNRTTTASCNLRALVKKSTEDNRYTMKVGTADCPELRGNYLIVLTGATEANIYWVNDLDAGETF